MKPFRPNPYVAGNLMVGALGVTTVIVLLACFCAWLTHVVVSIKTSAWVLLVMGSLVFPIGIVHGFAVWLGLV